MRSWILLGLFISFLNLPCVFSQGNFSIGISGSPQLVYLLNSGITENENLQYEALAGMEGGISLSYDFTPNVFIQLRANYSQEGGRYKERLSSGEEILRTTRLESFQFPLLGGYRLIMKNESRWVFMGGLQLAYLSRVRTYTNSTDFIESVPSTFYEFPNLYATHEQLRYSAVGNIGLDLKIIEGYYLNLYLQLEYGLNDVEDKDAFYLIREGANFVPQNYWEWKRSFDPSSPTNQLAAGLLIGLSVEI